MRNRPLHSPEERLIPGDIPSFNQRRLRLHVGIRHLNTILNRPDSMPHLQSNIPKCVKQPARPIGNGRIRRTLRLNPRLMQEHDVDIAKGIKLTTSVATKRHQRDLGRFTHAGANLQSCLPNVAYHHIHHGRPASANLQATCLAPVQQKQSMGFDLEKLPIPIQLIGRLAERREDQASAGIFLDLRNQRLHLPSTCQHRGVGSSAVFGKESDSKPQNPWNVVLSPAEPDPETTSKQIETAPNGKTQAA